MFSLSLTKTTPVECFLMWVMNERVAGDINNNNNRDNNSDTNSIGNSNILVFLLNSH